MKATFSSTWIQNPSGVTVRSRVASKDFYATPSYYEATNTFTNLGERLIKSGIGKFKSRMDNEASAEIELGSFYYYVVATVDEVENYASRIIQIDNDEGTLRLKQRYRTESARYGSLTDAIYGKKVAIFLSTFSLQDLRQAVNDDNFTAKINIALDELFSPHRYLLRQNLEGSSTGVLTGIKIHLLGDAYKLLSKRLRGNIGSEPYAILLRELGIQVDSVPITLFDGLPFQQNANHLKFLMNNLGVRPDSQVFISRDVLKKIFGLIDSGQSRVVTNEYRLFYARPDLSPLPRAVQIKQEPVTIVPSTGLKALLQKEPTPFQVYKSSDSKEPFPLVRLVAEDFDTLPKKQKELLLRYLQMLDRADLPNKERFFLKHKEKSPFQELNKYLTKLNVTPLRLFTIKPNLSLCNLYLCYRKREGEAFSLDSLRARLQETQIKETANYLFVGAGDDEDFKGLTNLDPGFKEAILSDSFLEEAYDLLVAEEEAQTSEEGPESAIGNENEEEPSIDGPETTSLEETSGGITYITQLSCPLLEKIGFTYEEYSSRFPTKPDLIRKYHKIPSRAKREQEHDLLHDLHMARFVDVNLVLSDGKQLSNIRIKRAEAIHALRELQETGRAQIPYSLLKIVRRDEA